MDVSRGGAVIAAGPTDLRRYLPISLLATAIVAGLPLWAVFGLGQRAGFLATALSVAFSYGLGYVGALLWERWPGSRDVVFNDLMIWGFLRRIVTQRRLLRRVERLGFSTMADDPDALSIEERTDLLKKLAIALETGDPYTHGHSQRVARHAYMVAKTMKLSRREAEKIRLAGVIHDVGKLRIPREVITKPGKLTEAEFQIIKNHTVDGARMVEALRDPELTSMVRHHHERLDGSGYPDRLSGDEIPMGARVLAVADTFDAASSLRPYRGASKHKVALDILQEEALSGRLDPAVVEAFVAYYSGRRGLRWWAFLSTSPLHLQDLSLALVQRVSAAGLANAAVVGITAVALVPGSPLHGRGPERANDERANRTAVASEERTAERGHRLSSAPGRVAAVTGGTPASRPTGSTERKSPGTPPRRGDRSPGKGAGKENRPDSPGKARQENGNKTDKTTKNAKSTGKSDGAPGTEVAGTVDTEPPGATGDGTPAPSANDNDPVGTTGSALPAAPGHLVEDALTPGAELAGELPNNK